MSGWRPDLGRATGFALAPIMTSADRHHRFAGAVARTLLTVVALAAGTLVVAGPASAKQLWIPRAGQRIAAYVQPGRGPAIVLCHGFPDNHHLYDRVVPLLKGHEVVSFDLLGWGQSSKPAHHQYTFAGQERDLNAVISGLHLSRVVLVGHDASVPAVLNWTLDHPGRVESVILSNGFYSPLPGSGPPALTAIFAFGQYPATSALGPLPPGTAAGFRGLMRGLAASPRLLDDLLTWQESTFIASPAIARRFTPLFTRQFLQRPSTLGALSSLAGDLFSAVARNAARLPALDSLNVPVRIVWGARDPTLGLTVAESLHRFIPDSSLAVFRAARHNLMLDAPAKFASAILRAAAVARP